MSKMNRRQFLAAGALGSAGVAWAGQQPLLQPWNAGKSRSLKKGADPVPTVCVGCEARCPILAYRDHGRVTQVAPNPAAGDGASICARAYGQVEALYDPERVLSPLLRVGARGEGRWQAIPWEAALGRLRSRFAAAGGSAWVEMGRPDPLALAVLNELGVDQVVGARSRRQQAVRAAQESLYGAPLARPHLADVRTVLLVGARPWDNGSTFAPLAKSLARAKADGAEILALSSYQGATGSVASRWIPIRPGSEAVLLSGLAHLALRDERADRGRLADMVDGDLDALALQLSRYTAEHVGQACGVAVEVLEELARRWVARAPGVCLVETAAVEDVVPAQSAAALLNALAGSPLDSGAGIRARNADARLPAAEPERARDDAVAAVLSGPSVPLYLAYRANPVYRGSAECAAAFADEGQVGFLVCMDTHLTETAQLADLVLPAAADLELWNLFGGTADDGRYFVSLQQPAPRAVPEGVWLRAQQTRPAALFDGPGTGPLGQARQLGDMLLDLLGPAGSDGRSRVPHPSVAGFVRERARELGLGAATSGLLLEPAAGDAVSGGSTPVGRLRIDGGLDPQATTTTGAAENGRAFTLVVLDHPEIDPAYANTRWGREVRRTNPLYLHSGVARQLGLARGSVVVVSGGGREFQARVQPVEGIHPEAVAIAGDFGHWAGGMAATASDRPQIPPTEAGTGSRRELLSNPLALAAPTPQPAQVPWWHADGAGVQVGVLGDGGGPARVVVRRI